MNAVTTLIFTTLLLLATFVIALVTAIRIFSWVFEHKWGRR